MASSETPNWTTGAPKWAAVVVLGAASVAAVGWAVGRDGSGRRFGSAQAAPTPPPLAVPTESAPPPAPTAAARPPAAPDAPSNPQPLEPAAPPLRKLINVNTASQGELELLPGIGPALAKRIIEFRTTRGTFKRVDDLDAVKGIGPKILERIRSQVTVQ
jgi:competence protein ComEA